MKDLDALLAIVYRFRPFVQGRMHSIEDAEDLLHRTFAELAGSATVPENLYPYVYGALRFQMFNLRHAHLRTESIGERSFSYVPTSLSRLILGEQAEQVSAAIAALPKLRREIIERFYYRQQKHAEIEDALGLTPTQFRLLKSRTLQKLRHSLAP